MSDSLNHTDLISGMLAAIGEDPQRDGLKDTPARVAKSWAELYGGYRKSPKEILSRVFEQQFDEMIIVKDIEFFSMCEHHMLPFFGKAHVAYIPQNGKVVGLSKIARLVECFARRLQLQERLTAQVGQAIVEHLSPLGVAVIVEAKHTCMMMRGVTKQSSAMVTSYLNGLLKTDSASRAEFLSLVK